MQKRAYFDRRTLETDDKTAEIDENDERSYNKPQIFLYELFKLHEKGLVDDKNIRDHVLAMVSDLL